MLNIKFLLNFKEKLFHPDRFHLFKNFTSLSSVQAINYIFPLIVIPYIVRIIGVEKFGVISFAQAIISYFIVIVTFGFNLYMPKEISINRDNINKLRDVFWNIMYSRILLCLLTGFLYIFLILFIKNFRNEFLVFLFTFGYVLSNVFLPIWFYQGIEKMTYIAVLNFLTKILQVILILIFVRLRQDYIFIPLIYSTSELILGIIAMINIVFYFNIKPVRFKLLEVYSVLKDSFILFISSVSVSIYNKFPPIFLGFFAGNIYVGYYAAAEKLFFAWMAIQTQLTNTLYPYVSNMVKKETIKYAINFIRKIFYLTLIFSGCVSLFTFIFAKYIILIIYGHEFIESIFVLRILCLLFVIIGAGHVFGIEVMLPFNMKKQFFIPIFTASIVSLISCFILIPYYKHIGAALSFLISEICVTGLMFIFLEIKGIKIINRE